MRFLIELYGFPLRTTDLAINLKRSKLFEVFLAKGEPAPPCPWHKLRQRCRIFQLLLLAPIPPSHKVEGHRMNYAPAANDKGKPAECALPKLKPGPSSVEGRNVLVFCGKRREIEFYQRV